MDTTARDILAAIKVKVNAIHEKKRLLARLANGEVIDKKAWNSLHRKELHLLNVEEMVFNIAMKRD